MSALIPIEAFESHIGILGKTGSGKSNLAKVLAEQLMHRGERVCAIDPTGTWWGLRLETGGKKPSLFKPVIFGGDHADIPIGEQHGAVLAEAIGTSADSAVIDTQQMTVGQRTRFFAAFAETLLRANRGPLHLIIDEAHVFAPQGKVNDPQSGAMLHAANNLVSLGRGRGLRIMLISQRPAKLHKDSLTQVETLIAMRLIAPQDTAAVKAWIGEWAEGDKGAEIIKSLPSLPRGDAWVWSPQIGYLERKHFPLATTFDSGTAEANASPRELPPIDTVALGDKMDAIRQEAQASDPKRLKARIAELEREKKVAVPQLPRATKEELDAAYELGKIESYSDGHLDGYAEGIRDTREILRQELQTFTAGFALPTVIAPRTRAPKIAPPPMVTHEPKPTPVITNGSGLPKSLQRCLNAIAWWKAIGFEEVSRDRAAVVAGLSPTASTFGVYLSKLKEAQLVENGSPGCIKLTPKGLAFAEVPDNIDRREVARLAKEQVGGQAARVLDFVLTAYPESISRDDLADRMELSRTASTLGVYLSKSSKLGFVESVGGGMVRAADWLFP